MQLNGAMRPSENKMKELLKKYGFYRREMLANQFLAFLMNWDNETEARETTIESREPLDAFFAEKDYAFRTSPETAELIDGLALKIDEIEDPVLKYEISQQKKGLDRMRKVPQELYVELSIHETKSQAAWGKAKRADDYSVFEPYLEKMIELKKRLLGYYETDELKGYDVFLDMFAEGMRASEYDVFFGRLEKELVPFIKEVVSAGRKDDFSFADKVFPAEKQKLFADYITDVMCFDRKRGLMKESEHPFTSGFGRNDVRVTNHYYPEAFASSIFSAIHELGHGTYEQQSGENLVGTLCEGCASLALHESQSRFFENHIGRSSEFWQAHFQKLKEIFPDELEGVDAETMYRFVNKAECSFVRTEADELTYPLHIMLRYNIEKELFEGNLKVSELPERWNELFREYFGLEVKRDSDGVLQDIHWACGDFGYFPTYALGSAYAAQIFDAMNKDFDVLGSLAGGTTESVNKWLERKLHRFGSTKAPKELFGNAVGGDFDAGHYINYLKDKYGKLYGIKG